MDAIGHISELIPNEGFYAFVPFPDTYIVEKRKICDIGVKLDDGRTISADQRKKIYATIRDISDHTGYSPDEYKAIAKYDYIARTGCDYFSLSDVDMTTANAFLNYLIEFCVEWDIPTLDSLLDRSPDTSRYLYSCIANKRCAICGGKSELHHSDHIGTGRNRKEVMHAGMRAEALCRKHHTECHNIGQKTFDEKYHIYGIKLDRYLCEILKLKG